jgi:hypothetical protein
LAVSEAEKSRAAACHLRKQLELAIDDAEKARAAWAAERDVLVTENAAAQQYFENMQNIRVKDFEAARAGMEAVRAETQRDAQRNIDTANGARQAALETAERVAAEKRELMTELERAAAEREELETQLGMLRGGRGLVGTPPAQLQLATYVDM